MNNINQEYQDYLRDESRSTGQAESIFFPVTAEEVRTVLLRAGKTSVTIQGARTGLSAGAVPQGGHILNLSKMNKITGLRYDQEQGRFVLTVQAGVLLSQIKRVLQERSFDTENWSGSSHQALDLLRQSGQWFFPPDPTETSASIGGMVACNASGARSYYYGPTRKHVEELTVVLSDGSLIRLQRGRDKVEAGRFNIITDEGRRLSGTLPSLPLPAVKNASGYYLQENMDLIDLFVGSEGTLGIVTEADIRLLPLPAAIWGVTVFLPCEESALRFVHAVRSELCPVAIEFFDHRALALLKEHAQAQNFDEKYHTAIYVEFHDKDEVSIRNSVMQLGRIAELCGGDEEKTWVATNRHELEKLHLFRHATPETVNTIIDRRRRLDSRITKLNTDMAVPSRELDNIVRLYNRRIEEENLEAVVFGHIGDNHIHVNILPRSIDDYLKGKILYLEWAKEVVAVGGTVSAEHGIGKMKVAMLKEMIGESGISQMKRVKEIFDPLGILCPGNLFPEPIRAGE
ncbi:MAG: D-lactate dehydrogenase (cytochrome) [Bacillota bacterium]|nr:MAG: D-lactate dehydrogenase (cytochrome) [Bacillota bacterium]